VHAADLAVLGGLEPGLLAAEPAVLAGDGRTIVYVAAASLLCLLIGYPAAYFVSRFAGRRKGIFLVLLIVIVDLLSSNATNTPMS
jgi:ABC-type spermidine/putrescine transport system permease subunit I